MVLRTPTGQQSSVGPQSSQTGANGTETIPAPPPMPIDGLFPYPRPAYETTRCEIRTFWSANPALWLAQVNAAFEAGVVPNERQKFNTVVARLPQGIAEELSDLIFHPPAFNRYAALCQAVLRRLSTSADTQLHQVLNEVRLEDRTPSQLLRHMRRLANDAISDEALKVKWLDILPPHTSRLCRVLQTSSLEELAQLADLAMVPEPQVHAVASRLSTPSSSGVSSRTASPQPDSDMAALQATLAQLLTTSQRQSKLLETLVRNNTSNNTSNNISNSSSNSRALFFHPGPGKLKAPPPPQAEAVGAVTERRLHITDQSSKLKFLVDTGSAISLLPLSHFKETRKRSPLTLSAANASAIDTYGTHSLTLDLALAKPLSWKFIVADVSDSILGADFLAHFGLSVDLHHRQLLDADHSHHTTGAILPARVFSVAVNITADVAEGAFADVLRDQDLATPGSTTISLPDLSALHHIVTNGPPAVYQTAPGRALYSCRTVPDRYPLPVIEDLLLELQGNTFSVIDLKKAFYQVPIAPKDAHKTAITTPFGLFEFTSSSMGLRNAAQYHKRAMDHLLRDLPFARAYLDDIVVASRGREQHLEHLLFATLRKVRIKINQD
ncbi:uncharacterized protein LOC116417893, partial [Nasonia vitripennis]|uniref:Gag-pol polyprotein n=1 Tax=Nasonia vitripennis TaxID=7425 RepID=A0A7M7QPI0_NASVI